MPTPKKSSQNNPPSASLEDQIKSNLEVLEDISRVEDAEEDAKSIVCVFYKKGGNPSCTFCSQPSETVISCKEDYISKIVNRPMPIWEPSFDEVEVREKKKPLSKIATLKCDNCYFKDNCPEYKAMATCAIDFTPEGLSTEPKKVLDTLIIMQQERIHIARAAELSDGGIPDQNLSNEMDRLNNLLASRSSLDQDKFSLKIEASSQNSGGGILAKIFGGGNTENKEQPQKTLDVSSAEVVTPIKDLDFSEDMVVDPKKPHKAKQKVTEKTKKK